MLFFLLALIGQMRNVELRALQILVLVAAGADCIHSGVLIWSWLQILFRC